MEREGVESMGPRGRLPDFLLSFSEGAGAGEGREKEGLGSGFGGKRFFVASAAKGGSPSRLCDSCKK